MPEALKFVVSLLKFLFEEAPAIAPEIRKLAEQWATKKGIPPAALQPALEDHTGAKVAAVDAEVNQLLRDMWADKTPPA